jgi:hypothetical protein
MVVFLILGQLALRNVGNEDFVNPHHHHFGLRCQRAMILPRSMYVSSMDHPYRNLPVLRSFSNAEREDATLTLFQLWLFVLAITGVGVIISTPAARY